MKRGPRGDGRELLSVHTPRFSCMPPDSLFRCPKVSTDDLAHQMAKTGGGGGAQPTIADFPANAAAVASLLHFCWKFDQVRAV